jgi:hypothetical protein
MRVPRIRRLLLAAALMVKTGGVADYPSTHSVLGGAAAAVMARFFGADEIAFTMTSGAPFAGIARSFTSLSQAARENAESRVLGGIHFRSACARHHGDLDTREGAAHPEPTGLISIHVRRAAS